jgi:hypothetical protein
MEEKFSNDIYKELLTILSYCENSLINNIPKGVIQEITDYAADSDKEYYVDKNKSLLEQSISDECKDLLGIMYFMYAADEKEKDELLNTWLENERWLKDE